RIGAFGFSSGGFTVLALAGGVADLKRVGPHCEQHPSHYACNVIRQDRRVTEAAVFANPSVRDARVRAVVSAAPALGFTFTRESLEAFGVPVQLWRAERDEVLPHPWYAEAVRAGLPKSVDYREVANAGHFDFLAPCSASFAAMARPLCNSAAGFDRVAFHQAFNTAVVAFFSQALKK
ncbi:MAG: dienelactone hydrolase, partial [Rhizobacter sp.]